MEEDGKSIVGYGPGPHAAYLSLKSSMLYHWRAKPQKEIRKNKVYRYVLLNGGKHYIQWKEKNLRWRCRFQKKKAYDPWSKGYCDTCRSYCDLHKCREEYLLAVKKKLDQKRLLQIDAN